MKKIIKIISFLILIFCSSTTFIHATEPQGDNSFYQNIEVLENILKESAIEYKKNQTFNLNGQNRAYEKLELDFQQLEDYKNLHKDIYLEEQVTSIDSIVSAVTDLEILDSYVSNIQKVTMKEQEEKTNYFGKTYKITIPDTDKSEYFIGYSIIKETYEEGITAKNINNFPNPHYFHTSKNNMIINKINPETFSGEVTFNIVDMSGGKEIETNTEYFLYYGIYTKMDDYYILVSNESQSFDFSRIISNNFSFSKGRITYLFEEKYMKDGGINEDKIVKINMKLDSVFGVLAKSKSSKEYQIILESMKGKLFDIYDLILSDKVDTYKGIVNQETLDEQYDKYKKYTDKLIIIDILIDYITISINKYDTAM